MTSRERDVTRALRPIDAATSEVVTRPKTVLSLCDRSGVMVEPWVAQGFDAVIVDLQHDGVSIEEGIGRGTLTRVGADVRDYLPAEADYAAVFAFPPCTHLAASGARWFQEKGQRANLRSVTPEGFARAVFDANRNGPAVDLLSPLREVGA